jgi:hypothetical protein
MRYVTSPPHNLTVRSLTDQQRRQREKEVVVLIEIHRAIIYTTKMSKQVMKSDAVHMYP